VRKKSSASFMKRVLSATVLTPAAGFISHISSRWSSQCAPAPFRSVGPGIGTLRADLGADVLLGRVQPHLVAAGQLELQHAAGGRQRPSGSVVVLTPQASILCFSRSSLRPSRTL
jgi:hypothetical protein